MLKQHRILGVLLVLLLISGNMAFSGHVSSHTATDSGLCSLCIHPGGPDSALIYESGSFVFTPVTLSLIPDERKRDISSDSSHDHQSRAPPFIT